MVLICEPSFFLCPYNLAHGISWPGLPRDYRATLQLRSDHFADVATNLAVFDRDVSFADAGHDGPVGVEARRVDEDGD